MACINFVFAIRTAPIQAGSRHERVLEAEITETVIWHVVRKYAMRQWTWEDRGPMT